MKIKRLLATSIPEPAPESMLYGFEVITV